MPGSVFWGIDDIDFINDVIVPQITFFYPTASGCDPDTKVYFYILDEVGVDFSTLQVSIADILAYNWNGEGNYLDGFQEGFNGPESTIENPASGIHKVVFHPTLPFSSYQLVEVVVNGQDLEVYPNIMPEFSWSFRIEDTENPYVEDWFPIGEEVEVSALISFKLKDDGAGVDLTKTSVTVENSIETDVAYNGQSGGFQEGYNGPASTILGNKNIYDFVVDPKSNFKKGESYTVTINSEDLYEAPSLPENEYADFDGGGSFFESFDNWKNNP